MCHLYLMKKASASECAGMARLYREGKTFSEITARMKWTAPTIKRALDEHGVSVRPNGKLDATRIKEIVRRYKHGEPSTSVARDFNITPARVCQILRAKKLTRSNREARPPLPCREDFFDVINTEPKAYWLGFLAADGCVHRSVGRQIRTRLHVNLGERDRAHLETFLRDIDSPAKIGNRAQHCVGFVVTCDRMTTALIVHGVVPRKSFRLRFPTTVPSHLIRHLIRGYFDGNGSAFLARGVYPVIAIVGTRAFLLQTQKEIKINALEHLKTRGSLTPHMSVWQLRYNGKYSTTAIQRYLYEGATRWLPRKREKFRAVVMTLSDSRT